MTTDVRQATEAGNGEERERIRIGALRRMELTELPTEGELAARQFTTASAQTSTATVISSNQLSGSGPMPDEPAPSAELRVPGFRRPTQVWNRVTLQAKESVVALRAIVVSKALQTGFPIGSTCVDIESDADERTTHTVLRVYTGATAPQALAFWNSLGGDLDLWLSSLSGVRQETARDRVGIRFHWGKGA